MMFNTTTPTRSYQRNIDTYDSYTRATGFARIPFRLAAQVEKTAPDALKAGVEILDVGCGTGRLSEAFFALQPDAKITGIDPSFPMRDECQSKFRRNKNFSLYPGEYNVAQDYLHAPNAQYDIVAASGVFDHLPFNHKVAHAFLGAVKPGGLLAFTYERNIWNEKFTQQADRGPHYLPYHRHKPRYVGYILQEAGAKVLYKGGFMPYLDIMHMNIVPVCGMMIARKPV